MFNACNNSFFFLSSELDLPLHLLSEFTRDCPVDSILHISFAPLWVFFALKLNICVFNNQLKPLHSQVGCISILSVWRLYFGFWSFGRPRWTPLQSPTSLASSFSTKGVLRQLHLDLFRDTSTIWSSPLSRRHALHWDFSLMIMSGINVLKMQA